MGESPLSARLESETELTALAAELARDLRAARAWPLMIGLRGDLGSGKTTWARAMLRGLGYGGRVPSPTYTLAEHYRCDGLTVVHLDLYRLRGSEELEHLGLRDALADAACWIVVEWPERVPELARRCDLELDFAVTSEASRQVTISARTAAGIEALKVLRRGAFNNEA